MFWIIGANGAAKALAEMLSDKGMIPSTAGNIIGEQFEHAEWEGLRFYDLIFPLFIFVTGVAIVFSLTRLIEQESKSTVHWRVLRRSLLLFALGLVYGGVTESWPDSGVSESSPDIRLLGVLNRIALCYLFASLLFLNLRLPGLIVAFVAILDEKDHGQTPRGAPVNYETRCARLVVGMLLGLPRIFVEIAICGFNGDLAAVRHGRHEFATTPGKRGFPRRFAPGPAQKLASSLTSLLASMGFGASGCWREKASRRWDRASSANRPRIPISPSRTARAYPSSRA
jgi:Domain of unknown function (DUF5009)